MDFPIPKLERFPIQISPCPILNAVLEIPFVTGEDWELLPGLLYTQIKERYPKFEKLPIAEMRMRYIDFFEDNDIFSHLVLDVRSGGESVSGVEMNFGTATGIEETYPNSLLDEVTTRHFTSK